MNRFVLTIIAILYSTCSFCIDFKSAVPFIENYSEKDFKVSGNNQDIVQDKRGIFYFANDYGILEYDGYHWDIIQIASNRSNIQSLAIDDKSRLYVGAHGDIGYLYYNSNFGLDFKSLTAKIPQKYQIFGDVFTTFCLNNKVYFSSKDAIFIYENDSVAVITNDGGIDGTFKVRDRVIVQSKGLLYQLNGKVLQAITITKSGEFDDIRSILPYNNKSLLLLTHQNGLFLLENGIVSPFETSPYIDFAQEKILSAKMGRNNEIAVGTTTNGIYFIGENGVITSHLNRENGLQNNTIKELYFDKDQNLWSANNLGIDMIESSSPFSRIIPENDEAVGVYGATVYNNRLYIATHNGLMVANADAFKNITSKEQKFSKIKELEGIIWGLTIIDGSLLVFHENGITEIRNNQILQTIPTNGAWKIEPIPGEQNRYIVGTYTGFLVLKRTNNRFELINSIDGFPETCRVFTFDSDGYIWMAHGYKGIYKLKLNSSLNGYSSVKFYDISKGLPLNYFNSVNNIKDHIFFTTQRGLYQYDSLKDTITKANKIEPQLASISQFSVIQEDFKGNLWFVSAESSGVVRWHTDGSETFEKNPLLKLSNLFIPGFEFLTFLENDCVLLGTKDGLVYYNNDKRNNNIEPFNILLREVRSIGVDKTLLFMDRYQTLCDTLKEVKYNLSYAQNNLEFSYSTSCFENINNISYQFYLEGFDKDWSDWSKAHYKQYTNLPEGTYIYRVRARNTYNTLSNEDSFRFVIRPPWFRTFYAYAFYLLSVIFMLWVTNRVRNRRLRIEKLRYIKEQVNERQIERANFKEEKLQTELSTKNQELSGLAMKVIFKNEKLSELKDKVASLSEIAPESLARKFKTLLDFIDSELNDDNWEDFAVRFDSAHNNFIARLKIDFPDLTPGDLKTCAYLRMNLSTKEIARLQNMTVRGVETARQRIRKKMGLDATQNLNDFIITY